MGFDNAVMWSLHPKELLTFFVPSFFGLANETYWGTMPFQQISHYVGYVVLCLAAIALIRRQDRSVGFLWVLVAVGIFMAFGRHIGPVYRLIYNVLPGFRRFRVPAMSLTLAQFSLAWVLREPNVASAIIGASRPEQVHENVRASGAVVDARLFDRAEAIIGEALAQTEPA